MGFAFIIITAIFAVLTPASSNAYIVTTHPVIKDLLLALNPDKGQVLKPITAPGDPHLFSPTVSDVALLAAASHIYLPTPILQQAAGKISAKYPKKVTMIGNQHPKSLGQAHFWLDPRELINTLSSPELQHFADEKHYQSLLKELTQISSTWDQFSYFKQHETTCILSHDGLAPLFDRLGCNVIILSSSDFKPLQMQILISLKSVFSDGSPKNIWWIEERQYPTPPQFITYKERAKHHFTFDTLKLTAVKEIYKVIREKSFSK